MVFSKIVLQGKNFINEKRKKIKNIKEGNKNMKPGFSSGDSFLRQAFEEQKQKVEIEQGVYNSLLSEWSALQTDFGDKFLLVKNNIDKCLKKCKEENENGSNEELACKVGCRLTKPELMDWKNKNNANCSSIIDKCSGRNVNEGYSVTEEEKDNCYDCGGGLGGATLFKAEGTSLTKNVDKCKDLDSAFLSTSKPSGYYEGLCNSAFDGVPKIGYDFKGKYSELERKTNEITRQAIKLENEKNKLKIKKQEMLNRVGKINIADLIDDYNSIYNRKILERGKSLSGTNDTAIAQLEDIELKEKSESMQLYLWSGLAILSFLLLLQKIKK